VDFITYDLHVSFYQLRQHARILVVQRPTPGPHDCLILIGEVCLTRSMVGSPPYDAPNTATVGVVMSEDIFRYLDHMRKRVGTVS